MVPESRGLRVLVVEDEALLAMQIETLLLEAGCEPVGQAAEAGEAVALAESRRPQVALVDVHLRDGRSGTELMRALTGEHGMVGLFITGSRRLIPPDFAGASGVLLKPFTERAFMQALDYLAQRARGRTVPPPASPSLEVPGQSPAGPLLEAGRCP